MHWPITDLQSVAPEQLLAALEVAPRWCHSFGRADRLDRATLERLVRSIRRVLDAGAGEAPADAKAREQAIEIEASFELGIVHVVEQL